MTPHLSDCSPASKWIRRNNSIYISLDPMRIALVALFAAGACAHAKASDVGDAIEQLASSASKVVLYSLRPIPDPLSKHSLEHYPIVGEAEITARSEQQALLAALARGHRESPKQVPMCFKPHHGLRVESRGHTVHFVICFECLQFYATGLGEIGYFTTSRSPQRIFDEALARHHIAPK